MLKIKGSVELKELEKYGFKRINYINNVVYKHTEYHGKYEDCIITVNKEKVLHFNQMSVNNEIPDILYDLIKDGIVEKDGE